jgi:hypothetical protein
MNMPEMKEGKTVKNGKLHLRQKCRNHISVLVTNAENYTLKTFIVNSFEEGCLN